MIVCFFLIARRTGKVRSLSNWPHCFTLMDVLFVVGEMGDIVYRKSGKKNDLVTKAMD